MSLWRYNDPQSELATRGMVTIEVPRSAGVYQILCTPTGKVYIGSAVDLRHRWTQARRRLRRCIQGNAHLQQAWSKYSEASFEFSVLEFVAPSDLLRAEQTWIDRTGHIATIGRI